MESLIEKIFNEEKEQVKIEIAIKLLDTLNDEIISEKCRLAIDKVKELRKAYEIKIESRIFSIDDMGLSEIGKRLYLEGYRSGLKEVIIKNLSKIGQISDHIRNIIELEQDKDILLSWCRESFSKGIINIDNIKSKNKVD